MRINRLISKYNWSSREGSKIEWIVIHYVGALGGAEDNCSYYAGGDRKASAHYYVGFRGEVWQSVEDDHAAWSVGVDYGGKLFSVCKNKNSINIEMCVRKKNTRSLNAGDSDWYFEDATVASCVELTKMLMEKYSISADHVVRHYDVCAKWCPAPYCKNNTPHTWEEFKCLISRDKTPAASWYRIRKTWPDEKSQIGAYKDLDTAVKSCPYPYKVFDDSGRIIFASNILNLQAVSLRSLPEAERIRTIAPLYQMCQKDTGMLASVGLAQFCLESGYATTDLADVNNLHGMKINLSWNSWPDSAWDGTSKKGKWSPEVEDGKTVMRWSEFRAYPSCLQSIYDRAAYFIGAGIDKERKMLRYPGIAQITDPKRQAQAIKDGHYATDPDYAKKICSLIDRWNLTQYDLKTDPSKPTPSPDPTPEKKAVYRVQVGAYNSRILAKAAAKVVKDKSGFDCFVNSESGALRYHVYCGCFEKSRKGAEERESALKAKGIEAEIKIHLL